MRLSIKLRPQADRDIDEAAERYLYEANADLALKFLATVERTWDFLRDNPNAGSPQGWLASRLRGCRKWRIADPFQVYQVFYCPTDTHLDVVRVLHGARDLGALLDDFRQI